MCSVLCKMAQWLSWLERRPVTAEVTGSSPVWVVIHVCFMFLNAFFVLEILF